MSLETQRAFLTGKVTRADFGMPVRIPNKTWKQPENAPYGEFFILGGTPPIAAGGMGKGKIVERSVRMVQLTIWIPEGNGTKPGTDALDKFKALFAYRIGRDRDGATYTFNGMQDYTPDVKAGWTCMIGRIPFRRDETTNVSIAADMLQT